MLLVTERARKLRAQCAMQVQCLRARIEIRVNRIPVVQRKANMEELFAKQDGAGKPGNATANTAAVVQQKIVASPSKNLTRENQSGAQQSPSTVRTAKRLR